jgi:hypothetical protein
MINDSPAFLQSLEELGALNESTGVFEVKPFKDWKGNKIWKDKIFKMRLCNAGELLEIFSYIGNMNGEEKSQASKFELLIRSIFAIGNRPLITIEELQKYNEVHKSTLTEKEYLRSWIGNLEDVVIERLDMVYAGLGLKQMRKLQGQYQCGGCGKIVEENSLKDSKVLKYSISEIICKDCIKYIDVSKDMYDFEEVEEEIPNTFAEEEDNEEELPINDNNPYVCVCEQTFDVFEDFIEHRKNCDKANA